MNHCIDIIQHELKKGQLTSFEDYIKSFPHEENHLRDLYQFNYLKDIFSQDFEEIILRGQRVLIKKKDKKEVVSLNLSKKEKLIDLLLVLRRYPMCRTIMDCRTVDMKESKPEEDESQREKRRVPQKSKKYNMRDRMGNSKNTGSGRQFSKNRKPKKRRD